MSIHKIIFSAIGVLVFVLGAPFAVELGYCAVNSIQDATTFAICEYVDIPEIVDELINSGVEVALRGYFKWGGDPTDWSAIAEGVDRLHEAKIPVIGGFTASTFFLYEDATTEEQFDDFVTRDADGNIALLWEPHGAHYAINNPAVIDFLVEHARAQVEAGLDGFHIDEPHVIGATNWNLGNEGYDDYAIAGFRNYLKQKYPDFTDADWKLFFDIDDIDTFNYREYLAEHGWDKYPTFSYFVNPLAKEWGPLIEWFDPLWLFTMNPLEIYSEDHFHGWSTRKFLQTLIARLKELEDEAGRPLYTCVNGTAPYVDFQMNWIFAFHNSFRLSIVDWILQHRRASKEFLGKDVPEIFFLDWPASMEWYSTLPEQKKIDWIRIYSADTYAGGCFFAFHFHNYLQDFRTNGTHELILHLIKWLKAHSDFYHDIEEHPQMKEVSTDDQIISHTLWLKSKGNKAFLHLINHDYTNSGIVQKKNFEVVVPISNIQSATLSSPDFNDEFELSFKQYRNGAALQIPRLDFYDVVTIEFASPSDDDTDDDTSADDEGGAEEGCGC